MRIKLLLFILYINLYGFCIYVPCEPSVTANTTIFTMGTEQGFLKINYKINEIENNYAKYNLKLKENNNELDKNKNLKILYLLILNEIKNKQIKLQKKKK